MQYVVETDRLLLRKIVPQDAHDLFVLDSDPLVNKFLGNKPVQSIEESIKIIAHVQKQYEQNGIGRWAVILKESNALIGWSGLKLEDGIRAESYYDLGYRFMPKYWNKGFATEAAIASLKYGFETLNYPSICAAADVNNEASNNVIQKCGLVFIETFMFENALHNWYRLTKEKWLET